ncbi:MAG: response regulator transcription factor [Gammaproteobacteria bacterium]|nr:response regulator transcription factor [Gammaproteobacteria bacterium]
MPGGKRILVIEDDPDISQLLEINLRDSAFRVDVVNNGIEGLERAANQVYQLIVLDLMLPGLDGLEICKRLRGQAITVPILMLTAKTSEFDRVLGLELGADDYLTKPFSIMELQARVKAILRRADISSRQRAQDDNETIASDSLLIDVSGHNVSIDGRAVELTAKEFDLLLHFARHPGRVYSRAQLLDQIWGYSHSGYEHTVNTHINRLRKKIEAGPATTQYIETVWGVGYRFRERAS